MGGLMKKRKKDEKEAFRVYESVARDYHDFRTKRNPQGWFYNEFLEMPATFELLGNVKGKKVLDFGCGTGIYAKILRKQGAVVKGFDISDAMLAIARTENPGMDLRIGSGYRIPFKEKFDVVVAALVIDYLEDWNRVFREVRRVLKKGGSFIFSVGNPICECSKRVVCGKKKFKVLCARPYFEEGVHYGYWRNVGKHAGKAIRVPSYHKTYESIIRCILQHGFVIEGYKDTKPALSAKKLFPKEYREHMRYPYFCAWRVRKT